MTVNIYHMRSGREAWWYVLSTVVSICVSVNLILLNCLRYHHEIFMTVGYGQKLGRVQQWLHSDALQRAGCDVTCPMF